LWELPPFEFGEPLAQFETDGKRCGIMCIIAFMARAQELLRLFVPDMVSSALSRQSTLGDITLHM
jgi:hypothetical protein